jgi:CelD/BcsL family acetyltransferase involved in cellulose biosynthesis
MLSVDVVDDLDAAWALAPEWDELVVERAIPHCAPGWMLTWWETLAPPRSELRVLAIREGAALVALAPWFVQRGVHARVDVRFLGAGKSDRVDILCRPGREHEVEEPLRRAILAVRPSPDLVAFEAVPIGSSWRTRLAGGPAGRLRLSAYRNSVIPAPTVSLPGTGADPESWLAGRSSNFRSQMRRMRRRLQERGGRLRQIVDPGELGPAVDRLLELHAARWENRAPSHLLVPGVRELLVGAATALGPERLRLWVAEISGELISAQLFIAAGTEVKYWNGGWMEEHADLKPTMLTILAALEDGIARGQRRLDLGAGTHPYKMRFADGVDPLTWGGVIVRNGRFLRTRAEFVRLIARYRAKRFVQGLPEGIRGRIERRVRGEHDGGSGD